MGLAYLPIRPGVVFLVFLGQQSGLAVPWVVSGIWLFLLAVECAQCLAAFGLSTAPKDPVAVYLSSRGATDQSAGQVRQLG